MAALFFLIYSRSQDAADVEATLSKYYEQTIWNHLARLGFEYWGGSKLKIEAELRSDAGTHEIWLRGVDQDQSEIFCFLVPKLIADRLIQKYRRQFFANLEEKALLEFATDLPMEQLPAESSDLEIRMNTAGYQSWQQKYEQSFWFDFGKAWFWGFDDIGYSVNYSEQSQTLKIYVGKGQFAFTLPRPQIANIIAKLAQNEAIRDTLNISSRTAILNYSLEVTDSHDLKITPVLELPNAKQPLWVTEEVKPAPIIFGRYIYVPHKGFYPFERKVKYYDSRLFGLETVTVPNEDIPLIIREYRRFIDTGDFYSASPSLRSREFVKKAKAVELFVEQIEDDWLYLSVKYTIGSDIISLHEIYQALRTGKRFLIGKNYWVDLCSNDFAWLQTLIEQQAVSFSQLNDQSLRLKLDKMNFIKIHAHLPRKGMISARPEFNQVLERLKNFQASNEVPSLNGRNYELRPYQRMGYEWLWFLYENHLSGLLCDDMGLGKTYQSLALLDAIMMSHPGPLNFLVVCPTSVLPHWQEKLLQLKRKVRLHLYYGSERHIKNLSRQKYAVVLTSYGILRNDLDKLSEIPFEVAIFDEIQTAKNKASLTNAAVNQLKSKMRIGLTGTPIENNLNELKALFDIILPSYLGSDAQFKKRYFTPIERRSNETRLAELQQIIRPFILRRTKHQVLQELPPKIEEIRRCELSADQVRLYQDVLNTRASALLSQLYHQSENVPYIHIFAVLNYLKQICNHPAQLEDGCRDYTKYQSGKWDLFCELLDESLNSGFKVIVFSQYLNMLGLIEAYLEDNHIPFATIKGETKDRKAMIDRFNNDPSCLVFTGSLRASSFGINLTGGSVVIHYDRWWNSAVENQATDRAHRIGQMRGVQVFKLVTEGTLEEKIDRLIQKKQQLIDDLVQEDDANIVKKLTRDELIDLLTFQK
ncbi:MAG: DEAD/DEAH box helicase [candidate division KSB1 bacterium]|nr:DEAD/DEAH box helicase [candidate division KSB1 bacterium]